MNRPSDLPPLRAFRPLTHRHAYPGLADSARLLREVLQRSPDPRHLLAVDITTNNESAVSAIVLDVRADGAAVAAAALDWERVLRLQPGDAAAGADPKAPYQVIHAAPYCDLTVFLTSVAHSGHARFTQFDPPPLAPGPLSAEGMAMLYFRAARMTATDGLSLRHAVNIAAGGEPDGSQALATFALCACLPPDTLAPPHAADAADLLERWPATRYDPRDPALRNPVPALAGPALFRVARELLNPVHLLQSRPVHPGFGTTAPHRP